jgi:hypothetical protein
MKRLYSCWGALMQSICAALFIVAGLVVGSENQWVASVLLGFAAGALSRTVVMHMRWLPERRNRRKDDPLW